MTSVDKDKDKVTITPTTEELCDALDYSKQQRNRIAKAMHRVLPEVWPKGAKLDENGFYDLLILSVEDVDIYPGLTRVLGSIPPKSGWRGILVMRGRLVAREIANAAHSHDSHDLHGIADTGPREEIVLETVVDALGTAGEKYRGIVQWLQACDIAAGLYLSDPETEADVTVPATETDDTVFTWDQVIEQVQELVSLLAGERFDTNAIAQLSVQVDVLRDLAQAHQRAADALLEGLADRLQRVADRLGDLGDEDAEWVALFEPARRRLSAAVAGSDAAHLPGIITDIEVQAECMVEARQQYQAFKQQAMSALGDDRLDEAQQFTVDSKQQNTEFQQARTALMAALREMPVSDEGVIEGPASQAVTGDLAGSMAGEEDASAADSPIRVADPEGVSATVNEETVEVDETVEPDVIKADADVDVRLDVESPPLSPAPGPDVEIFNAVDTASKWSPASANVVDDQPSVSRRDVAAASSELNPGDGRSSQMDGGGVTVSEPRELPANDIVTDERQTFSYEDYCKDRWIAPNGTVEPAPWRQSGFSDGLRRCVQEAVAASRWASLLILCRAETELGLPPDLATEDLYSLYELWAQPDSASAGGAGDERHQRLLAALRDGFPRTYLLLLTLLEMVRPSVGLSWASADREALVERLQVASVPLRAVVEALLKFQQHGDDGWRELVSKRWEAAPVSAETVLADLAAKREAFAQRVTELWSAAGGKIQRTHCRDAWTRFMTLHVQPIKDQLSTTADPRDFAAWDLSQLQRHIKKLPNQHRKIADRFEARFSDRNLMDKRVREITDQALDIVKISQSYSRVGADTHYHGIELPLEQMHTLVQGEPLPDRVEELCRRTFLSVYNNEPVARLEELTGIGENDLWRYPDLLPLLGVPEGEWRSIVPVEVITDPLRAAAVLLYRRSSGRSDELPGDDIPRRLRERLILKHRTELLPYLVTSSKLDPQDKTRIHREEADRIEQLHQGLRRLEQLRLDADALSLPGMMQIDSAYKNARELLDDRRRAHAELPLIKGWIDGVCTMIEAQRNEALASLHHEIVRLENEQQRQMLEADLATGRFGRVLRGLRPGTALEEPEAISVRETVWRWDAERHFAESLTHLGAVDTGDEVYGLASTWRAQRQWRDANATRSLRSQFYNLVSGEGVLSPGRKKHIMPERLRVKTPAQISIDCRVLLDLLRQEGLNPTFLPQLRDFSQLVIMSPPPRSRPATVHQELSRSVGAERERDRLVVFLMPGLLAPMRERILDEFRRRDLHGAVIDDIDVCRLIGVGNDKRPHGFLSLLEIVIEQLNWQNLSPYQSRDGQFIQMEMFVGRESEADKLAKTAQYTRVFSGRKLGKSALLKYVAHKHDGADLPSGNHLRVLYIIVAGGDSEQWLADRIITEICRTFTYPQPEQSDDDPGQRLALFLENFLDKHADTSLLIILDEADAFVEGQLQEYDRIRERCLSFRMMKDVPGGMDRNDLPRVRFVFSGYRVTNTRAGAWANAGEVLRLSPLNEVEAVRLVEGPLARLGIDAHDQADAIARHCGFQPAIIIRFGDALLKQVQATQAAVGRRKVCIGHEDVVNTFHQGSVQDEIRTINDNNFQGNRVGRIVFWAMLMAFNDLLPGQGLEDAPRKLLERIREVDDDTSWLRKLDPSETGEILRNLHDFRDRELIVEDQTTSGRIYRMKFPAHLPVLMTEEDPRHQVRQEIERVREAGSDAHTVTSLLSNSQMDDIRYAMGDDGKADHIRLVVVSSHWLAALQHEYGGVPDRLGKRGGDVIDAKGRKLRPADVSREPLLVFNAGATTAAQVLKARDSGLGVPLLIGGVDVLRWAIDTGQAENLLISYLGLSRLDETHLGWWYERLRLIRFAAADAVSRIVALTSGIPLLLARWHDLLPDKPDIDIDAPTFESYVQRYTEALEKLAHELVEGGPACRLTRREIELLRMASLIARENNGEAFSLHEEMGKNWHDLYGQDIPAAKALFALSEDGVAIEVITRIGLLPVDGRGQVHLPADDALHHLLDVIP